MAQQQTQRAAAVPDDGTGTGAEGTVEMMVLHGISMPDLRMAFSDVAAASRSPRIISIPRLRRILWADSARGSAISGRIRPPCGSPDDRKTPSNLPRSS